jgi:hypothetical protein
MVEKAFTPHSFWSNKVSKTAHGVTSCSLAAVGTQPKRIAKS